MRGDKMNLRSGEQIRTLGFHPGTLPAGDEVPARAEARGCAAVQGDALRGTTITHAGC